MKLVRCCCWWWLMCFGLIFGMCRADDGDWMETLDYVVSDLIERGMTKSRSFYEKFNSTLNRFLCPEGWIRVGKSCYQLIEVADIAISAASLDESVGSLCRVEAVRKGRKLEDDANARVSVVEISDDRDVDKLAKFLHQKNASSCRVRKSSKFSISDTSTETKRRNRFIGDKACSSLKITRDPESPESECFLMHYTAYWSVGSKVGRKKDSECTLKELTNCFSKTTTMVTFACHYATDLCSIHAALCGTHGKCVDRFGFQQTLNGIRCECNFLYGGRFCDRVTWRGIQLLVCGFVVLLISMAHSDQCKRVLMCFVRFWRKTYRRKDDQQDLLEDDELTDGTKSPGPIKQKAMTEAEMEREVIRKWRTVTIYLLTFLFTAISLGITLSIQAYMYRPSSDRDELQSRITNAMEKLRVCQVMTDLVYENLITCPISMMAGTAFILLTYSLGSRSCVRGVKANAFKIIRSIFLLPMNPFQMTNRSSTVIIFGSLTCEVLKIFEDILFKGVNLGAVAGQQISSASQSFIEAAVLNQNAGGLLNSTYESFMNSDNHDAASSTEIAAFSLIYQLLVRIGFVFLVGMRYYPLLVCMHLLNSDLSKRRNAGERISKERFLKTAGFCALIGLCYSLINLSYIVAREGFCMGFTPVDELMKEASSKMDIISNPVVLSTKKLILEAKMRFQLIHWYLIYGLLRNTPQFIFHAYIIALLVVRIFGTRSLLKHMNHMNGRESFPSVWCRCFGHQQNCVVQIRYTIRHYWEKYVVERMSSTSKWISNPCAKFESYKSGISMEDDSVSSAEDEDERKIVYKDGEWVGDSAGYVEEDDDVRLAEMYVKRLLSGLRSHDYERRKAYDISRSFIRRNFYRFYEWNDDFRYSNIAMCTFTTTFMFIYYLCLSLVFSYIRNFESARRVAAEAHYASRKATELHGSILSFYFGQILNVRIDPDHSFVQEVVFSGITTFAIFAYQLFNSMKQYKRNKIMMFKAMYEDIPSCRNLKPIKLVSQSVHYSGFVIGYTAWAFVIVFHILLIVFSTVSVITRQSIPLIESVFTFLIPIVLIYGMKMIAVRGITKTTFTQGIDDHIALKNRRVHACFVYFNFFFDCFLGVIACFTRITRALIINVIFISRLDYSFLGRPLEKLDPGFSTYVAYLHTEVAHTHPVLVVFCNQIWKRILRKRQKSSYDRDRIRIKIAKRRSLFRWFIVFTLMRNVVILRFRKRFKQSAENAFLNAMEDPEKRNAILASPSRYDEYGELYIENRKIKSYELFRTNPRSNEHHQQQPIIVGWRSKGGSGAFDFRAANFEEREIIWRQEAREQIAAENPYRFAYGHISSFPAIGLNLPAAIVASSSSDDNQSDNSKRRPDFAQNQLYAGHGGRKAPSAQKHSSTSDSDAVGPAVARTRNRVWTPPPIPPRNWINLDAPSSERSTNRFAHRPYDGRGRRECRRVTRRHTPV